MTLDVLCISKTHSPAEHRPLAHRLVHHTHKVLCRLMCVCVSVCPCCTKALIVGFLNRVQSLSMRDNLSDAVYLSLPCSHSHSLSSSCPFASFLLHLPLRYSLTSCLCIVLSTLCVFPLSVLALLVLLLQRPRDINIIKTPSKKETSLHKLSCQQTGFCVSCCVAASAEG